LATSDGTFYTTQDFAGTVHMWKPDATLVNSPSLTLEEVEAIVEEAHRLGLKVACAGQHR
jgi:hypothetical protein